MYFLKNSSYAFNDFNCKLPSHSVISRQFGNSLDALPIRSSSIGHNSTLPFYMYRGKRTFCVPAAHSISYNSSNLEFLRILNSTPIFRLLKRTNTIYFYESAFLTRYILNQYELFSNEYSRLYSRSFPLSETEFLNFCLAIIHVECQVASGRLKKGYTVSLFKEVIYPSFLVPITYCIGKSCFLKNQNMILVPAYFGTDGLSYDSLNFNINKVAESCKLIGNQLNQTLATSFPMVSGILARDSTSREVFT
jgi:hypothetical protein